VGFSNSAIGLGATMPISYVVRFNRKYRGEEATNSYHSLLVDASSNEEVAEVARIVTSDMGLALDDKYENAQKAGLMITIVTAVFSLISVLIIIISAVNIMHTFLMLIVERRRELGIMRAIGATKVGIGTLIVLEAAVVGVIGGALGSALGVAATFAVDAYLASYVGDFPFKPDTLFAWEPWFFAVGIGGAALFCLLGAVVPAARAANTDPAAVLTGH
jgi:ABC-type lipoprotein release transport system permease subunit